MNTKLDHTTKNPKIMDCVCKHVFQDARYGHNMRVHNPAKENKYRCTVCGRERAG